MIKTLNHITLAVKDIETSFEFYCGILGLNPLVKWDQGAYFLVGEKENGFWFCLNVDKKREPNPCYTHYAFIVDQEQFQQMKARIIAADVHAFKDNTSPGDSFYFLDPDGHKLEIHVGDHLTRIKAKKAHNGHWKNVEWFV